MYRVDGLIEYYYQRKISGMAFTEIQQSLNEQRHIENEDRETILKEVERRERIYQKQLASKRIIKACYIIGVTMILISLAGFFLNNNEHLKIEAWVSWVLVGTGVMLISSSFFYSRSLRIG